MEPVTVPDMSELLRAEPALQRKLVRLAKLVLELRNKGFSGSITLHLASGEIRKVKTEEWEKW